MLPWFCLSVLIPPTTINRHLTITMLCSLMRFWGKCLFLVWLFLVVNHSHDEGADNTLTKQVLLHAAPVLWTNNTSVIKQDYMTSHYDLQFCVYVWAKVIIFAVSLSSECENSYIAVSLSSESTWRYTTPMQCKWNLIKSWDNSEVHTARSNGVTNVTNERFSPDVNC